MIKGRLMPSTSEDEAERALWQELDEIKAGNISDYEMEKVKNKFEANMLMGEINIMNKALNLGFYAMERVSRDYLFTVMQNEGTPKSRTV